jgi:hypothetical protein
LVHVNFGKCFAHNYVIKRVSKNFTTEKEIHKIGSWETRGLSATESACQRNLRPSGGGLWKQGQRGIKDFETITEANQERLVYSALAAWATGVVLILKEKTSVAIFKVRNLMPHAKKYNYKACFAENWIRWTPSISNLT